MEETLRPRVRVAGILIENNKILLIEHLKKDASELQKIGVNGFDVFMLLRMGYTNEGLDLYSQKSFSTKLGHSNE